MCPKEGNKESKERCDLEGAAEDTKLVQLREDQGLIYNLFIRGSREGGADLFPLVSSNRTQGNGLKLHRGKFRLDIRKKVFIYRVAKLPRGAVMTLSLCLFKTCLDNALTYGLTSRLPWT